MKRLRAFLDDPARTARHLNVSTFWIDSSFFCSHPSSAELDTLAKYFWGAGGRRFESGRPDHLLAAYSGRISVNYPHVVSASR